MTISPTVGLFSGFQATQLASTVLLPGDPGRIDTVAELLDVVEVQAGAGDHRLVTGTINGERISAVSAGIGCPLTAAIVEELAELGVQNIIRIGTCGALQPYLAPGVMVIATAAVAGDGTSRSYGIGAVPAIADLTIAAALSDACSELGLTQVAGVVRSHDAFYLESPWAIGDLAARIQPWIDMGVLALENESSALFAVANSLGIRAGSILASGFPILDHPDDFSHGDENKLNMVRAALRAAQLLAHPTATNVGGSNA